MQLAPGPEHFPDPLRVLRARPWGGTHPHPGHKYVRQPQQRNGQGLAEGILFPWALSQSEDAEDA